MRSRYRIHDSNHAHFITAMIVQWLLVFGSGACCDIVAVARDLAKRPVG
jgi:hypothetical protein